MERDGQGRENKLVVDQPLLDVRLLQRLGEVLVVHEGIRVEQVQLGFPEDARQVAEKLFVNFFDLFVCLLLGCSVHQIEDTVRDSVGIGPLLHAKSQLKLLLPELEDQGQLVVLIELDRVRDLAVQVWLLVVLDDLIKMRMECFRHPSILPLAIVLLAELKHLRGCLVVKNQELAVGSQGVQDALADVQEEGSFWKNLLLFFKVVKAGVSDQDKVLWGGIDLVDLILVSLRRIIREDLHQLVLAIALLKLQESLLRFVSQVSQHFFEEIGRLVLAKVSKVTNVFFEVLHSKLVDADINHKLHKFLKDVQIFLLLGSPMLKTEVEGCQSVFPFALVFVKLFSSLPASLWGCIWC